MSANQIVSGTRSSSQLSPTMHSNATITLASPSSPATNENRNAASSLSRDLAQLNVTERDRLHNPLLKTRRTVLQEKRADINEKINKELRMRNGAANMFQVTRDRKIKEKLDSEIDYFESNLKSHRIELDRVNSSLDVYQKIDSSLPMIAIGTKTTTRIDFTASFRQFINEHYYEEAQPFDAVFDSITRQRECLINTKRSNEGITELFHYSSLLNILDKRFFPPDRGIGIVFTCFDAFTGEPFHQRSIAFEKGAVLFSIAALYSQLAADMHKDTIQGLTESSRLFLLAEGCFCHLLDNFSNAPSLDMRPSQVKLLLQLMRIQAYECSFLSHFLQLQRSLQSAGGPLPLASTCAVASVTSSTSNYTTTAADPIGSSLTSSSPANTPSSAGGITHTDLINMVGEACWISELCEKFCTCQTSVPNSDTSSQSSSAAIGSPTCHHHLHHQQQQQPEITLQHIPRGWIILLKLKASYYRGLAFKMLTDRLLVLANLPNNVQSQESIRHFTVSLGRICITQPYQSTQPRTPQEAVGLASVCIGAALKEIEESTKLAITNSDLSKMGQLMSMLKNTHNSWQLTLHSLHHRCSASAAAHMFSRPELRPQSVFPLDPISPSWAVYAVPDPFQPLGPIDFFSAKKRWTPARTVRITRDPQSGFGFSIRGDSPVFVVSLDRDGCADRAGLRISDVIVRIGHPGRDVRWSGHLEIVEYVRGRQQIELWVVTQLTMQQAPVETNCAATPLHTNNHDNHAHHHQHHQHRQFSSSSLSPALNESVARAPDSSPNSKKASKKRSSKKGEASNSTTEETEKTPSSRKRHQTLFWKPSSSSNSKSKRHANKNKSAHSPPNNYNIHHHLICEEKPHTLRVASFGAKNHRHGHHQHDDVISGYSCMSNSDWSAPAPPPPKSGDVNSRKQQHRRVASSSGVENMIALRNNIGPPPLLNDDVNAGENCVTLGCACGGGGAGGDFTINSSKPSSWKARLSATWKSKSKRRHSVLHHRESLTSSTIDGDATRTAFKQQSRTPQSRHPPAIASQPHQIRTLSSP